MTFFISADTDTDNRYNYFYYLYIFHNDSKKNYFEITAFMPISGRPN